MKEIIRRTTYENLECIDRPDIYLKLECNQFANSFKARGIINFLSQIDNLKGLVTFTTGNHGIAVAKIAQELNLRAIILTTNKISNHKRIAIENCGAKIQQVEFYDLDEATSLAKQIAIDLNYTFVPLFDDKVLLEGYSEIAKEICSDFDGNLIVYFPIGSGSLLFANAKELKAINSEHKVVGVEPKIYQRLNGVCQHNDSSLSIADSLAIDRIPTSNLELTKYTDEILALEEFEIADATKLILEQFNLVIEPSGAIGLAAALKTERDNQIKIAVITGKNISRN